MWVHESWQESLNKRVKLSSTLINSYRVLNMFKVDESARESTSARESVRAVWELSDLSWIRVKRGWESTKVDKSCSTNMWYSHQLSSSTLALVWPQLKEKHNRKCKSLPPPVKPWSQTTMHRTSGHFHVAKEDTLSSQLLCILGFCF